MARNEEYIRPTSSRADDGTARTGVAQAMVQLLLEQLEEECKSQQALHTLQCREGARNETPAYFGIRQSHRRYATLSETSSRFAVSMQYPRIGRIFYMTEIRPQIIHF